MISVLLDGAKSCRVVVPDDQLSLAIGKEGQNARLAAKLTGYKIDIKSESAAHEWAEEDAAAEAERAAQAAEEALAAAEEALDDLDRSPPWRPARPCPKRRRPPPTARRPPAETEEEPETTSES